MSESGSSRRVHSTTPARRAEIIQAALDSFLEDGYYDTSLRAIAARIGITHAGLRHHFDGKEDLLSAVLDKWEDDTQRWFESQRPVTSLDDLTGLLVASLRRHQDEPALVQLLVSMAADAARPSHAAHERFRNRYADGRVFLAGYLRPLQQAGEVDATVDAEDIAAASSASAPPERPASR